MFKKISSILIISIIFIISCGKPNKGDSTLADDGKKVVTFNNCEVALTPQEINVLINKGTEFPFTGELLYYKEVGTYSCKICGTELFKSEDNFNSGTGWPSFDDAIVENIKLVPDGDRVEVTCAVCGAHMGHVFYNEGFTEKGTRYCINSVSLSFKKIDNK